jgi:hypothetical protein
MAKVEKLPKATLGSKRVATIWPAVRSSTLGCEAHEGRTAKKSHLRLDLIR